MGMVNVFIAVSACRVSMFAYIVQDKPILAMCQRSAKKIFRKFTPQCTVRYPVNARFAVASLALMKVLAVSIAPAAVRANKLCGDLPRSSNGHHDDRCLSQEQAATKGKT